MNVTIESSSGFCSGVRKAISKAVKELDDHGHIYCLGDIVHNELEVKRLKAKGLEVIDQKKFALLKDSKVLIRAHGEPPSTFETARKNNLQLLDTTCPVVRRIQKDIRETYINRLIQGVQIAIFGKKDHPEVQGLLGQCEGKAIIINQEEDLFLLDLSKQIVLYSQTTMNPQKYLLIQDSIRNMLRQSNPAMEEHFQVRDTICSQVSRLAPIFGNFARQHQMIIFVASNESSNGRFLYKLCREANPMTYLVGSIEDLEDQWFKWVDDVGVCGATSSPVWLLQEIATYIETHY